MPRLEKLSEDLEEIAPSLFFSLSNLHQIGLSVLVSRLIASALKPPPSFLPLKLVS